MPQKVIQLLCPNCHTDKCAYCNDHAVPCNKPECTVYERCLVTNFHRQYVEVEFPKLILAWEKREELWKREHSLALQKQQARLTEKRAKMEEELKARSDALKVSSNFSGQQVHSQLLAQRSQEEVIISDELNAFLRRKSSSTNLFSPSVLRRDGSVPSSSTSLIHVHHTAGSPGTSHFNQHDSPSRLALRTPPQSSTTSRQHSLPLSSLSPKKLRRLASAIEDLQGSFADLHTKMKAHGFTVEEVVEHFQNYITKQESFPHPQDQDLPSAPKRTINQDDDDFEHAPLGDNGPDHFSDVQVCFS